MTAHLVATRSPMKLARMPELQGRNGETITVSDSSAASEPSFWLHLKGTVTPMDEFSMLPEPPQSVEVSAHLDAETAWQLAEQLMALVVGHRTGDRRPPADQRIADMVS